MWIQIMKYTRIRNDQGRDVLHYPGETVDMKNKVLAAQLIAKGVAIDGALRQADVSGDVGLVVRSQEHTPDWAKAYDIPVRKGDIRLDWDYTILWEPRVQPKKHLMVTALKVLQRRGWDMALPLKSMDKLCNSLGNLDDRTRTEEVIHDLRVPYYETRLMFVHRTDATKRLIDRWIAEMDKGDERLAFMRALYHTPCMVLALPTLWVVRKR